MLATQLAVQEARELAGEGGGAATLGHEDVPGVPSQVISGTNLKMNEC